MDINMRHKNLHLITTPIHSLDVLDSELLIFALSGLLAYQPTLLPRYPHTSIPPSVQSELLSVQVTAS